MIRRIGAFGAFWYGFVVGDDWRVVVGVIAALAITRLLSRATTLPTWWIAVVAVAALLAFSIRLAIRRHPDIVQPAPR